MFTVNPPQTNKTIRRDRYTDVRPTLKRLGMDTQVGDIISNGFVSGSYGWRIAANGDVEFNNGTFRGTFNIGGTVITIGNTGNIQENLDAISAAGGGTLYLQAGTYTLTSDINIPGGVSLIGTSRDSVIIECGSYSVKMSGTNAYSTGTVTISTGGTTVVGSGTTWTSAMIGQYIYLGGLWYLITARTDNTHITIDTYNGDNLSGAGYAIADVNFHPILETVTVQNSSGNGIDSSYSMEAVINDISITGCAIGMNYDFAVYPRIVVTSTDNGVNLDMDYVNGFYVDFSDFSLSTSSDGVQLTNCIDSTFYNSFIGVCAGNGISLTNCSGIGLLANAIDGNTGHGMEFVSGNDGNQIFGGSTNTNGGDGIKMTATSDNNVFTSNTMQDNVGYGMNIAASTCDNNSVVGNVFSSNGTSAVIDSGTGTVIQSNSGYYGLGEKISVYKTATETVNNSSTLQNDDELFINLPANQIWFLEYQILFNSNGTANIKHSWGVPSGTTMAYDYYTQYDGGVFTESAVITFGGTGADLSFCLHGTVKTSSTAGTLQFKWAQGTANASNTKVLLGSYITATRIK